MIVTIDGPAGAGKSSVARRLADRLGYQFLDTGAMYRAVAWAALSAGTDWTDGQRIAEIAGTIRISFRDDALYVDDQDATVAIRTPAVTDCVRFAAGNEAVRLELIAQQQEIGRQAANLVTEGRDQGSVVFPQAQCKIFLTATPENRAKRRYRELLRKGEIITFAEVLQSQNRRDQSDMARDFAPLVKAKDAVEVFTDDMTQDEVVQHLVWVVESAEV